MYLYVDRGKQYKCRENFEISTWGTARHERPKDPQNTSVTVVRNEQLVLALQ